MTFNDPADFADPAALPPLRDPLFDSVRRELDGFDAPPGVRKELLAAFAKQQAQRKAARPWWRRWSAMAGGGAVLAALLVTLALGLRLPLPIPSSAAVAPTDTLAAADPARFGAFIALDTYERIAADPAPRVLATAVPRASLVTLGVTVDPQEAGDMVQAEMLVGAAGNPLALRLALE